jgi:hypothetical protein
MDGAAIIEISVSQVICASIPNSSFAVGHETFKTLSARSESLGNQKSVKKWPNLLTVNICFPKISIDDLLVMTKLSV